MIYSLFLFFSVKPGFFTKTNVYPGIWPTQKQTAPEQLSTLSIGFGASSYCYIHFNFNLPLCPAKAVRKPTRQRKYATFIFKSQFLYGYLWVFINCIANYHLHPCIFLIFPSNYKQPITNLNKVRHRNYLQSQYIFIGKLAHAPMHISSPSESWSSLINSSSPTEVCTVVLGCWSSWSPGYDPWTTRDHPRLVRTNLGTPGRDNKTTILGTANTPPNISQGRSLW